MIGKISRKKLVLGVVALLAVFWVSSILVHAEANGCQQVDKVECCKNTCVPYLKGVIQQYLPIPDIFVGPAAEWACGVICNALASKLNTLNIEVIPSNSDTKVTVSSKLDWKISGSIAYVEEDESETHSASFSKSGSETTSHGDVTDTGCFQGAWKDASDSESKKICFNLGLIEICKTFEVEYDAYYHRTFTLTPSPGSSSTGDYRFDHWEGDCDSISGDTCTVKLDSDNKKVTAVFQAKLTTNVNVGGKPLNGPNGDMGNGDYVWVDIGGSVTITADDPYYYNGNYYTFDHWEGCDSPSGTSCTVTVNEPKTVTAVYTQIPSKKFTVKVNPAGANSVDVSGKYCLDSECTSFSLTVTNEASIDIPEGATVTFTATAHNPDSPPISYWFDQWELSCGSTSTDNPWSKSFTIGDGCTLTAEYKKVYKVVFKVGKEDGGGWESGPKPISITEDLLGNGGKNSAGHGDTFYYKDGTTVTITADDRYTYGGETRKFIGWSPSPPGCSGSTCTFTITGDVDAAAWYWKLVNLNVEVKDELGGSTGCKVHLDFEPPSTVPTPITPTWKLPDGDYSDGDKVVDLYAGTRVTPAKKPCTVYRFDHWKLDGSTWSGGTFDMDKDRTIRVVYWKLCKLTISVEGSGSTSPPYTPGTYYLDRGTYVSLYPVAYAGWEFSHWTLDGTDTGSINSPTLFITMNSDHDVIAHFTEETTPVPVPTVPVAAPVYEGCILPLDFPTGMKYKGMYADLLFNEDLLRRLAGKAGPEENSNLFLLGGPNAIPYPWEHYDVHFEANTLKIGDQVYEAEYGYKDYGVILIDCDNLVVRIAGVNRFGTRAGLMWVLNHPDEFSGKLLVVVEWVDSNWNHLVEDGEIRVIYSLP